MNVHFLHGKHLHKFIQTITGIWQDLIDLSCLTLSVSLESHYIIIRSFKLPAHFRSRQSCLHYCWLKGIGKHTGVFLDDYANSTQL